jgi:hypothetical protein
MAIPISAGPGISLRTLPQQILFNSPPLARRSGAAGV